MIPDHYQALGVQPQATAAEIRAAYRRLMQEHHPDRRPGDPAAEETARAANAAWETLSDSARRASYDRLRAARRSGEQITGPASRASTRGDATVVQAAYSPEQAHFRQAFHRATLRVGVGIFVLGAVLLMLASR